MMRAIPPKVKTTTTSASTIVATVGVMGCPPIEIVTP
jgi:hypothetical protein